MGLPYFVVVTNGGARLCREGLRLWARHLLSNSGVARTCGKRFGWVRGKLKVVRDFVELLVDVVIAQKNYASICGSAKTRRIMFG